MRIRMMDDEKHVRDEYEQIIASVKASDDVVEVRDDIVEIYSLTSRRVPGLWDDVALILDAYWPETRRNGIDLLKLLFEQGLVGTTCHVMALSRWTQYKEVMEEYGVRDFLDKSTSPGPRGLKIRNFLDFARSDLGATALWNGIFRQHGVAGDSEPVRRLRQQIAHLALQSTPILIIGEAGSGKKTVARAIHLLSIRRTGKLLIQRCADIPSKFFDEVVFGSADPLAGSSSLRKGLLFAAAEGILVLEGIDQLSLQQQDRLLGAITSSTFTPAGASASVPLQARVVLTVTDSPEYSGRGRLHPELVSSLAGSTVEIPSLRQRLEDLPALVEFLAGAEQLDISDAALAVMVNYPWPGNFRELQRFVSLYSASGEITGEMAASIVTGRYNTTQPGRPPSLQETRDYHERARILDELRQTHGDVTRAAVRLDIDRTHLYRRMDALGIPRDVLKEARKPPQRRRSR